MTGPRLFLLDLTLHKQNEQNWISAEVLDLKSYVSKSVKACGPLTCSDYAAALCQHPAPMHECWAAAAAYHSDLHSNGLKMMNRLCVRSTLNMK